uniref:Glycerol-3-phosphate acyltransferase n=1 Tax=uncultured Chloroflexota bacterium TaxID=166587 RepID=H5SA63_9CHLR|nr:hypothetical conserved protein [uncultured Chloroflexota bacterium]
MKLIFWVVFGYLCGSIPFAFLVGKFLAHRDIRTVADGNPGATNVIRAGGWKVGMLAVLLDILKGFIPVYLARQSGLSEWSLVPVALAPILGHATQPFLGFRGGKALGASGGAWMALIGPLVLPIYALLTVPVLLIQQEHAWAAFSGMFSLLYYAAFVLDSPWLTAFAAFNTLIIGYTHRRELRHAPQLRPWLVHLFAARKS